MDRGIAVAAAESVSRFGRRFWDAVSAGPPLGKRVPFCGSIPGRSFRLRGQPETTSQSEPIFWDAFSAPCLYRKMRPILNAHSGMQLPYTAPLGKRVPLWGWIPGRGFRLRADPETASHSGAEIWDAVSAVPGRKGKTHPIPSINSGARFVTSAHASRQTKSVWCLPCSPQPLGTLA